jgi:hypothetical protein
MSLARFERGAGRSEGMNVCERNPTIRVKLGAVKCWRTEPEGGEGAGPKLCQECAISERTRFRVGWLCASKKI